MKHELQATFLTCLDVLSCLSGHLNLMEVVMLIVIQVFELSLHVNIPIYVSIFFRLDGCLV